MNPVNKSKRKIFARELRTDGSSRTKQRRLSKTAVLKFDRNQTEQKELDRRIRSKDWIVRDPNDSRKKMCKACKVFMKKKCFISSSERHLKNDRHRRYALLAISRGVRSELSVIGAKHNMSLHVAENFTQLIKDLCADSEIFQALSGEKSKGTKMEEIGNHIKSELASNLRTRKFSILADKLPDISSAKTYCITVRYSDADDGRMEFGLWKFSSMENASVVDREAVAEHLYKDIKESFNELNIPDTNIVGFGSDGSDVIMNGENSVASRFKKDYRGIDIRKFTNRSTHICASKACKSLPRACEELVRTVYSLFKCKVDKSSLWVALQAFFDLEPHGMLHPSQAYWISVTAIIDCMLEHWQELIHFYKSMPESEKLWSGATVVMWLDEASEIKLYYHFLQSMLCKFDDLNALFKSSHDNITEVNSKFERCYRDILGCFLKRNYAMQTRLQDIDPWKKDEQLPDSDMDLGPDVSVKIKEMPNDAKHFEMKKRVFLHCLKFMEEAVVEITKCWVVENSVMEHIQILDPKVARRKRVDRCLILSLARALPRISSLNPVWRERLIKQWDELPSKIQYFPEDIANENEPDVFWGKLLHWKNSGGVKKFSVLARFALDALVIPHTNADHERILREINLRRTRTSNELVSDFESTCRVAISSGHIKRDGTGRMVFTQSPENIHGLDSNTLQVGPEPIAATS